MARGGAVTPPWIILENAVYGFLTPAEYPRPDQGHNITQPPTIRSREELEAFIADLTKAADRVWPK